MSAVFFRRSQKPHYAVERHPFPSPGQDTTSNLYAFAAFSRGGKDLERRRGSAWRRRSVIPKEIALKPSQRRPGTGKRTDIQIFDRPAEIISEPIDGRLIRRRHCREDFRSVGG